MNENYKIRPLNFDRDFDKINKKDYDSPSLRVNRSTQHKTMLEDSVTFDEQMKNQEVFAH